MKKPSKTSRASDLDDAAGAFGGLAIAVAFAVKIGASLLAPSGIAAVLVAVGIKSPPLLIKALPIILGVCACVGAIAGLIRFVLWAQRRQRIAA